MTNAPPRGGWVIWLTFLMAFALDILPMPQVVDRIRPDWLALVTIYWCMALPHRVNIGTAWTLGLLQDAARGALLGQHALGLAVVAFLAVRTHRRIRVFPLWQQALSVLMFMIIQQLIVFWISGMAGYPPDDWWYLAPALGSMLIWPWVFILLRDLRRFFVVN